MLFYLRTEHERGQGIVEYALILILVSVVVVAALTLIPPPVANTFNEIGATLSSRP